jgi:hypothetical protein
MEQTAEQLDRWQSQAPQPRQMPAVRGLLTRWLDEYGVDFYEEMVRTGKQDQRPSVPAAALTATLTAQERSRLGGPLYWISPAMTQLAMHAGRQLPDQELYPHDLPSETGFMVFAEPLATYRTCTDGLPVEVVAASWGPWAGPPSRFWPHGGIWFTFWAYLPGRMWLDAMDGVTATLGLSLDPLIPENEAGWPFGVLTSTDVPADSSGVWAQTVCAAWLLMAQPLTTVAAERAPRPDRRRLKRAGLAESDVRIVRIRQRERSGSTHGGSGREYDHQWWVEGHWRRYYVGPGRTRVERRYIEGHPAGPDDKPFRPAQQVRAWDR